MTDQPELPEPTDADDTTGIKADIRPLNAPRPGALVSRDGFSIIGPNYHSPNDVTVKLHLYVRSGGSNRFIDEQMVTLQPGVRPFKANWTRPIPPWVSMYSSAYLLYQFKLSSGKESDWYDSDWFTIAKPPSLNSHDPNVALATVRPVFSGYGLPGCSVKITRTGPDGPIDLSGVGRIANDGFWELPLTKDLSAGYNIFEVRMWINAYESGNTVSSVFTFCVLPKPAVSPLPNMGLIKEPRPEISGLGNSQIDVDVHKGGDGTTVYGTVTVLPDNTWKVKLTRDLPQGPFHLTAKQRKDVYVSTWAVAVSAFGLFRLNITGPAVADQDLDFQLSGAGGLANADVVAYLDLTDSPVGTGKVASNGSWTANVRDLNPGTRTLTVVQKQSTHTSNRSVTKTFRIRPPKLTTITMTVLPGNVVRFSGSGYNGARVEITKVSGPGGQSLGPVTVVNNVWQLNATNWLPGDYSFSATQKVADNNSGWIASTPYTFSYKWMLPLPTVEYRVEDYTPVFSGTGHNGATVVLYNPGGASKVAPDAPVNGGLWSSRAYEAWNPTAFREVHLHQIQGQAVSGWVRPIVVIKLPPPVIHPIADNPADKYSPIFSGKVWPGGQVSLLFSDDATVYPAVRQGADWTFIRVKPFAIEITHQVKVTHTFDEQTSQGTLAFSLARFLPKVAITEPQAGEEVGRDLQVEGTEGVAGAQVQVSDAQFGGPPLGKSDILTEDGPWSAMLKGLAFREYQINAIQVMGSAKSEASDTHEFEVVVLPPVIEVPAPEGAIPRVAIISGTGMPGALVDVYLKGSVQPLLRDLPVDNNGLWRSAAVVLDVGHKTLFARQTFVNQVSRPSPDQAFRVVPAAPTIETPVSVEQVGLHVVVSGFGYAGDEVTVAFSDAPQDVLGRVFVRTSRTWSVAVELDRAGGLYSLIAVQSRGEFHSSPSADRPIVLGTYRPTIDVPAPGRCVSDSVRFSGLGLTGVGRLVSWYNPDRVLADDFVVTEGRWQSQAGIRLPLGINWAWFRQTIRTDDVFWVYSETVLSNYFEVIASPP